MGSWEDTRATGKSAVLLQTGGTREEKIKGFRFFFSKIFPWIKQKKKKKGVFIQPTAWKLIARNSPFTPRTALTWSYIPLEKQSLRYGPFQAFQTHQLIFIPLVLPLFAPLISELCRANFCARTRTRRLHSHPAPAAKGARTYGYYGTSEKTPSCGGSARCSGQTFLCHAHLAQRRYSNNRTTSTCDHQTHFLSKGIILNFRFNPHLGLLVASSLWFCSSASG